MPDFVKLVNVDYKPFDFHQNNVKRIIAPGEDVIVPWAIARTLLGDPRIPDIAPANERTKMYEKIRARHNYSAGLQTEDEWDTIRPHVEVYDIENNTRIFMLIEDPAGEHMSQAPTPSAKQTDAAALQRQIEVLTAQVTKLVAQSQSAPEQPGAGNTASPTAVQDGPGAPAPEIDSVFNLPTSDETATADTPQAVTVGDIPGADDDEPPAPASAPSPEPSSEPAKKAVAKKVAAKAK